MCVERWSRWRHPVELGELWDDVPGPGEGVGMVCLEDWGGNGSMCVAILDDGSFPSCVEGGWNAVNIRSAVLLVGRPVRCVGMRARIVGRYFSFLNPDRLLYWTGCSDCPK